MIPRAMLAIVTFLSACLPLTSSSLPGLQIRMSQRGLDYANSFAMVVLSDQLKTLRIPDQHGRQSNLDWTLTGISNRGVTVPSSSIDFEPSLNGLTWKIDGLGIDVHSSNWHVKYKRGWFKVGTSGSVDVKIERASLRVTASLGHSGGRPTLTMSNCHASIDEVNVKFHGGTAFILNLFRGRIGREIKDLMLGEICHVARKIINNDANKELARLKVRVALGPRFLLDYSLVATPKVRAGALDLQHKGEIYWRADVEDAPFSPKPIQHLSANSHMMYVWVTDYVANTAIHHAYRHGHLQYNITARDFPSGMLKSFLTTTCSEFCAGNFMPSIGQEFPSARMELSVSALGSPALSITPSGIELYGSAAIGLNIITDEGKLPNVVNAELDIFLSVTGSVLRERLAGEITQHKIEIKQIQTVFGEINSEELNSMLSAALDLMVVPELNALLQEGMDLPVTDVISFQATRLTLLKGSLLVATDVTTLKQQPSQRNIRQQLQEEKRRQQDLMLQQQREKDILRRRQREEKRQREEQEKQREEKRQREEQEKQREEKRQREEQEKQREEKRQREDEKEEKTQTTQEPSGQGEVRQLTETTTDPIQSSEQPETLAPLQTEQPSASDRTETEEETTHKDVENLSTTEAPRESNQDTLGLTMGQLPTKQEHNVFCSRVINFCHSSLKYCN